MKAIDIVEKTTERLNKDWFYHYMLHPPSFRPETIMPQHPSAPASPSRFAALRRRVQLLVLVAACVFCGCRTQTANYFRDQVMPNDVATKVVSAPVTLPIYIVLTLVDVVIINPIDGAGHVPRIVGDLWGWHSEKNVWVAYGALLPINVAATPFAVVGTTVFSEQFVYER